VNRSQEPMNKNRIEGGVDNGLLKLLKASERMPEGKTFNLIAAIYNMEMIQVRVFAEVYWED